jgi:hypothetical protein
MDHVSLVYRVLHFACSSIAQLLSAPICCFAFIAERRFHRLLTSESETPALLVNMGALESNLKKMAAFFVGGPVSLRPHFKNHKCVALAKRQIELGALGMTCAHWERQKLS